MEIKCSYELKKESNQRKLLNIETFSNLDKTGLQFGVIERRLLIRTFPTGEKLYLQYPGKESVRDKNPRPWDFRPKLQLKNGEWLKDLSFKDIWDDLYSFKDVKADLSYVATLFFRIAYMLDTEKTTRIVPYEDIEISTGKIINRGEIELTWYEYNPNSSILEALQVSPEALRQCSLMAYLSYNDYLAQNEDCKYYYRAEHEKGEPWKPDTGRRNTLLTHMSVIAFIEDILKFTEITDMFQRGLGVAPLPTKHWTKTTGGRVIL